MKLYNVIILPRAISDIEDAVNYYNTKQHQLGLKFTKQLEITLESLRFNPYYVSLRYSGIRCAKIKVFPFLIHYKIIEGANLVTVIAVYSTYKKPLW